ncbi:MAG: NTP transferase domain-containing protein [Candidatus Manganitrophus sp.]|nr:NTP transferase domain-containing protein [Candidatus Manganitrophus sp.]
MRDVNSEKGNLWAVVLAAGEGTRMNQFIRSSYGLCSPKQYIAFTGKRSMLQHTLDRVAQLIPPERTRIVVNPKPYQRNPLSSCRVCRTSPWCFSPITVKPPRARCCR